jgi:hypothetical protein
MLEARFGAGDGPPAGSVFGEFAHFDAAASGARFAAAAIASAGRDAAQTARSIGEEAGPGREHQEQSERCSPKRARKWARKWKAPKSGAAKYGAPRNDSRGPGHGGSFRRVERKTYSAGTPEKLEPG